MIEDDAHQRTRAILWCLADLRPDMPLCEALGYLKAVELQLEAEALEAARLRRLAGLYEGSAGAADLVRDYAAKPSINALAKQGRRAEVFKLLAKFTGASDAVCGMAADSLVNMLMENRPPF